MEGDTTSASYGYHLKCLMNVVLDQLYVMSYKILFLHRLSENDYTACFVINIE
jgi:hypothetical protein